MRHWRAVERPVSDHERPLDLSEGITRVRMGIGGLYRATRLAVRPALR